MKRVHREFRTLPNGKNRVDRNRLWSHVGIVFRVTMARGNPWKQHFPGTRYFVDKTAGLIDILATDCTVAPATSSRRVPYRPSHCTDSINDAINDSYRYILHGAEITRVELPSVRLPLLPRPRPWNKLAGKVATNDARPRWNRANASISSGSMFPGLPRPEQPTIAALSPDKIYSNIFFNLSRSFEGRGEKRKRETELVYVWQTNVRYFRILKKAYTKKILYLPDPISCWYRIRGWRRKIWAEGGALYLESKEESFPRAKSILFVLYSGVSKM